MGLAFETFAGVMDTAGYAAVGAWAGVKTMVTAPYHAVKDYMGWRTPAGRTWKEERALAASALDTHNSGRAFGTGEKAVFDKNFKLEDGGKLTPWARRKKLSKATSYREFSNIASGKGVATKRLSMRSPGEHLKRGASNYRKSFKAGGVAINLAIAAALSSDNVFDPREGFAAQLGSTLAMEAGFIGGGAAGAALGTLIAGPVGGVIGAVAGAIMGASTGESIGAIPGKVASIGYEYGKSGRRRAMGAFIDSEYAMTMRQRAIESISRSQMNARTALGSEALSYHY